MIKKNLFKSLLGIAGIATVPVIVATATSCNSSDKVEKPAKPNHDKPSKPAKPNGNGGGTSNHGTNGGGTSNQGSNNEIGGNNQNQGNKIIIEPTNIYNALNGAFTIAQWNNETDLTNAVNEILNKNINNSSQKIKCTLKESTAPNASQNKKGEIIFNVVIPNNIILKINNNNKNIKYDEKEKILTIKNLEDYKISFKQKYVTANKPIYKPNPNVTYINENDFYRIDKNAGYFLELCGNIISSSSKYLLPNINLPEIKNKINVQFDNINKVLNIINELIPTINSSTNNSSTNNSMNDIIKLLFKNTNISLNNILTTIIELIKLVDSNKKNEINNEIKNLCNSIIEKIKAKNLINDINSLITSIKNKNIEDIKLAITNIISVIKEIKLVAKTPIDNIKKILLSVETSEKQKINKLLGDLKTNFINLLKETIKTILECIDSQSLTELKDFVANFEKWQKIILNTIDALNKELIPSISYTTTLNGDMISFDINGQIKNPDDITIIEIKLNLTYHLTEKTFGYPFEYSCDLSIQNNKLPNFKNQNLYCNLNELKQIFTALWAMKYVNVISDNSNKSWGNNLKKDDVDFTSYWNAIWYLVEEELFNNNEKNKLKNESVFINVKPSFKNSVLTYDNEIQVEALDNQKSTIKIYNAIFNINTKPNKDNQYELALTVINKDTNKKVIDAKKYNLTQTQFNSLQHPTFSTINSKILEWIKSLINKNNPKWECSDFWRNILLRLCF